MRALRVCLLIMVIALCGCDKPSSESATINAAQSRQMRPADPALAAIYDRSCRSCHAITATRAPLTGDTAAWAPRMDKGMDVLVENVVNGFGGMPPFGLCMDCNAEHFAALIEFMAAGD